MLSEPSTLREPPSGPEALQGRRQGERNLVISEQPSLPTPNPEGPHSGGLAFARGIGGDGSEDTETRGD